MLYFTVNGFYHHVLSFNVECGKSIRSSGTPRQCPLTVAGNLFSSSSQSDTLTFLWIGQVERESSLNYSDQITCKQGGHCWHWRLLIFGGWGKDELSNKLYINDLLQTKSNTLQLCPCVCRVQGSRRLLCSLVKAHCGPLKQLDLPGEALSVHPGANRIGWGVVTWTVRNWEKGRDVRDGGQQQRAGLWAFLMGQRDDDVVLIPHMESVVSKRMHERKMAGSHVLQVVVLFVFFIRGWTQDTVWATDTHVVLLLPPVTTSARHVADETRLRC